MKETNMEHYRDEILEAIKDDFMFGKTGGEIMSCSSMMCRECDFGGGIDSGIGCGVIMIHWLMADYKPEITLTAREKHFVEFAEAGWIARDEDGETVWYLQKPNKEKHEWKCRCDYVRLGRFWDDCFAFVTWEDEEPWSIEELRKLKALEYNPEDVAFKGR